MGEKGGEEGGEEGGGEGRKRGIEVRVNQTIVFVGWAYLGCHVLCRDGRVVVCQSPYECHCPPGLRGGERVPHTPQKVCTGEDVIPRNELSEHDV